mmetsp:Transcript_5759/g.18105  ORF Transcript_5759/g.18105 Transcript_5759/m.18105 type:complete len:316 (-) Transcript_5759:624-1571(-)
MLRGTGGRLRLSRCARRRRSSALSAARAEATPTSVATPWCMSTSSGRLSTANCGMHLRRRLSLIVPSAGTSSSVSQPVVTCTVRAPTLLPKAMSVDRRSPTTTHSEGHTWPLPRSASDSWKRRKSFVVGLPHTTSGLRPAPVSSAATSEPHPGRCQPPGVGICGSVFVAMKSAFGLPVRLCCCSAMAAMASAVGVNMKSRPMTTAAMPRFLSATPRCVWYDPAHAAGGGSSGSSQHRWMRRISYGASCRRRRSPSQFIPSCPSCSFFSSLPYVKKPGASASCSSASRPSLPSTRTLPRSNFVPSVPARRNVTCAA